jgi:hypothetical protein
MQLTQAAAAVLTTTGGAASVTARATHCYNCVRYYCCWSHRRTLAERMRGTISFVDNVPRGTVMTLRVPANRPSDAVQAREARETDAVTNGASRTASDCRKQNEQLLQSKRILVSCVCNTCAALL